MAYKVHTSSRAIASSTIDISGKPIWLVHDDALERGTWAIFNGQTKVRGPVKLSENLVEDIKAAYRTLPPLDESEELVPAPSPLAPGPASTDPPRNQVAAEPEPSPPALDTLTTEIQILKRQTAANLIEIGRRLATAKEMVGHGHWLSYLKERVQFTERTAQRFMRVAAEIGNTTSMSYLEPTKALLLLEAPEEDRPALITQADDMTTRQLGEAVQRANQAKKEAEEAIRRAQAAETAVTEAVNKANEFEARAKAAEAREPVVIETPVFEAPPEMQQELEELRQMVADKDRTIQQREADVAKAKKWLEDVNKDLKELRERVDRNYELDQTIVVKEQRAKELTDLVTHLESSFADSKQNTRNGAELMRIVYPLERMAWGIAKEVSDLRKEGVGGRCEDTDLTKLSRKLRDIAADLDAIVKDRKDVTINVEVPRNG